VTLLSGASEMGAHSITATMMSRAFRLGISGNVLYIGLIFGTQLGGVYIPFESTNARVAILVIRNVGTIIFFFSFLVLDYYQTRSIRTLISKASERLDSPALAHFKQTLSKFEIAMQASIRRIVLLGIIMLTFAVIPPLFSFNYVGMSLMLALAAGKNFAAYNLKPTKRLLSNPSGLESPPSSTRYQATASGRLTVAVSAMQQEKEVPSRSVTSTS